MSAKNVRAGKRGNICVGNNVSATMCPRLPGPLALGNNSLQEPDFPKDSLCEVIKILGIYFGYDVRQRDNLNFRKTLKSMKEISQSMETKRPLPFRKDTNSQNFCYPKVYV